MDNVALVQALRADADQLRVWADEYSGCHTALRAMHQHCTTLMIELGALLSQIDDNSIPA